MHHIALESVDSTNAEAQRLIVTGAVRGWTMITARLQHAGRGRQSRSWTSPPGNLYVSFIVPKDQRGEWRRPWLSGFAVALALANTVEDHIDDGADVRIKWPNDVLITNAKAGGILIESGAAAPFLVIGIGVNLASHPPDTRYPATHVAAHRAGSLTPLAFANRLAAHLQQMIERWLADGFTPIRAEYLKKSHRPGDPLTIGASSAAPRHGNFIGIDEEGCLCLECDGAFVRFAAGDVFPTLTPSP
ncbi:MAG: biotin--[acetyl-CoA-carboxylase] ligase [Hyphomicrobiales bacterium]|nr:biotin--[acetyl-CoA-carboxylase] ligase [Hyphomicrobiales bacterium]OQW82532.1 MAG: biotin--[acetyl-CoA-carboxylase] ligase [Proteobacteria bacterium ST_bin15]